MELVKIKGTKDIFGPEALLWQKIESEIRNLAKSFYLSEIRTPIMEYGEVFKRAIGGETDIVSKEMFEFTDRGGRQITLRPEGTAGVVRALCENQMFHEKSLRFFYTGPMFRAERPQKGRQRQFHQIGIEIFGDSSPYADLDVILFNLELFRRLGLKGTRLRINSVGCPSCRPAYLEKLKAYLEPEISGMCGNCQTRYQTNLMRVLDCKEPQCAKVNEKAPSILEHLCGECDPHFKALSSMLTKLGVEYEVDSRIVRGLDYYTRTAFEIQIPTLGAQNAVCGGGRYDGLVSHFAPKQNLPGVGSAIGFERLVLALQEQGLETVQEGPDYYVVADPSVEKEEILELVLGLRREGFSVILDASGKNISKQLKEANRFQARKVLIFGEDEMKNGEVTIKDMKAGTQERVSRNSLLA